MSDSEPNRASDAAVLSSQRSGLLRAPAGITTVRYGAVLMTDYPDPALWSSSHLDRRFD